MKESDLYPPIARLFEDQGFRVQGEVCGCDLVAVRDQDNAKDPEIAIVELKQSFNVKLLYQAVRRLGVTPRVYVAFFRPQTRQKMSYWQMVKSLARRLHLGVLIVKAQEVQILIEPGPFQGKTSNKQKRKVLNEFHGRRVSKNQGGVTRTKINTAYLENAVYISVLLQKHRRLTAVQLRALGTADKTHAILYRNVYGWFERKADAGKGVYGLKSRQAAKIKKAHPEIWTYYEKLAKKSSP